MSITLLLRIILTGAPITANPVRTCVDHRSDYRNRILGAIHSATWARPIPRSGPLGLRVHVTRRNGRRGDADNICKPILDALGPVLGTDRAGRAADGRIRYLEVQIMETDVESERVVVELHALDTQLQRPR
jgi:Holliday junction resolvase RusA-like endonuclease